MYEFMSDIKLSNVDGTEDMINILFMSRFFNKYLHANNIAILLPLLGSHASIATLFIFLLTN